MAAPRPSHCVPVSFLFDFVRSMNIQYVFDDGDIGN